MDGEQALRILGSGFSPALIILDLNFPRVSGLTFLERTAPPVVVFSSSCNVDELSRAIALGAAIAFGSRWISQLIPKRCRSH